MVRTVVFVVDHCLTVTSSLPVGIVHNTIDSYAHHGHYTWFLGLAEVLVDIAVHRASTLHGVRVNAPDPPRNRLHTTAGTRLSSMHRGMVLHAIIYPSSAISQNSGCRTSSCWPSTHILILRFISASSELGQFNNIIWIQTHSKSVV